MPKEARLAAAGLQRWHDIWGLPWDHGTMGGPPSSMDGWFIVENICHSNGWWLGVASWPWKAPYIWHGLPYISGEIGGGGLWDGWFTKHVFKTCFKARQLFDRSLEEASNVLQGLWFYLTRLPGFYSLRCDQNLGLNQEGLFHISQMLHVWNIYLQNWAIFGVNVGKYSIHGASGYFVQWALFIKFFPGVQKDSVVFLICFRRKQHDCSECSIQPTTDSCSCWGFGSVWGHSTYRACGEQSLDIECCGSCFLSFVRFVNLGAADHGPAQ